MMIRKLLCTSVIDQELNTVLILMYFASNSERTRIIRGPRQSQKITCIAWQIHRMHLNTAKCKVKNLERGILCFQNEGLYPEKQRFSWVVLDEQFDMHSQWFA